MPRIIEGPPASGAAPAPLIKRLGWFALIWIASLAATAAIVELLRALIL